MNKKNKGLNSEIEPISEETANEFEKVLKDVRDFAKKEDTQNFRKHLIFDFILKTLQIKLVYESERYTKYCCNFGFATFITRWYWKRKMNKQRDIVKKTIKNIENVKAIYEKDEFHRKP